jgi:hypothetical protein
MAAIVVEFMMISIFGSDSLTSVNWLYLLIFTKSISDLLSNDDLIDLRWREINNIQYPVNLIA